MDRKTFYEISLPVLDAMLESSIKDLYLEPDEEEQGNTENSPDINTAAWNFLDTCCNRLCILGPTEVEVMQLMPHTAHTINIMGGWHDPEIHSDPDQFKGLPCLIPVESNDDLSEIIEDLWYWQWLDGGFNTTIVIAPPPNTCFTKDIKSDFIESKLEEYINSQRSEYSHSFVDHDEQYASINEDWTNFLNVIDKKSSAAIALSSILFKGATNHILILPDNELFDKPSQRLRQWCSDNYYDAHHSPQMVPREMRRLQYSS